jgi:3-oxoacyl-[acyl-carrier-protein] synthase-3
VLKLPAGGSKCPASAATVAARQHYMHIEGRRVFKFATTVFIELVQEAFETCGLTRDDVKLIVPHQVN